MTSAGRIAVVGLGLMGGSLVRRLAELGETVAGWSPEPGERAAARAATGAWVAEELDQTVAGASAVVLAAPLLALPGLLARVREGAPSAWVTDVGSLQAPPLSWAREAGLGDRYVSSHPMAGGEASGFAAARSRLYDGARVWLSHDPDTREDVRDAVEAFWVGLGARPTPVDPGAHDRRMALVSHLPQVVSAHLAATLADADVPASELGPGGRDTTRLAGSDPGMWRDVLSLGGPALPEALRTLARSLDAEAGRLDERNAAPFAGLLARTRAWRAG